MTEYDPSLSGHAALAEEQGGIVVLHKIVSRPEFPTKIKCKESNGDPLNVATKSELEPTADKLCAHCWPDLLNSSDNDEADQ